MTTHTPAFIARFFEQRMEPVVAFVYRRYWLVIVAAILVTLVALYSLIGGLVVEGGPKLRVNTDLSSLIPQNYKSVESLNKIKAKVAGIDKLEILIQSDDFESSLRFGEHLLPLLMALENPATGEPYLSTIEYRQDVEFFERNQLLFLSQNTLLDLKTSLEDRIQEEKNKINPLFVDDLFADDDESDAEGGVTLEELEARYEAQVPKEYLATDDGSVLMLRCFPFGSSLNLSFAQSLYNTVEDLIARENPASFHPSMFVELGGEVRNRVEEYTVITTDAVRNLGGGMLLQILLITFFFRQPLYLNRRKSLLGKAAALVTGSARQLIAAVMLAIPLLLSIIWTFGLARLAIGGLNTITVFLFVILFGMGIDFGIHTYSRYLETRLSGAGVLESLETTILKTGAGICTAAMTTAAAFFTLMVADFKGFSDFGFIAGTGILLSMTAMLVLLPAFVTLGEKLKVIHAVRVTLPVGDEADRRPLKHYRSVLIGAVAVGVVVAVFVPRLSFEYDFRDLRANLPELQGVKAKIHDLKVDAEGEDLGSPAVILADSHEDLLELVEVLDSLKARDTEFPTIEKVESIFDKLPHDQDEKLGIIRDIRRLVDEEALDVVQGEDRERIVKLRRALEVDEPFTLDQTPLSVKRKFFGKDGSIGEFVLIYPSVLLRDGKNSIEFARDLQSLSTMDGIETPSGKTYYASSGSVVAADMLLLMQRDSKIAISLTTAMIVLLLFLNFRSVKPTLLVLCPLAVGFLVLWGIQLAFGIKYNLFNMVVLPVIIGYGVDDGVHIMHRYFEEGVGSLRRVIRTTGFAVIMTTITTSAGFAGLIFVRHGGLKSMGSLAVIGLMITMLTSLIVLPAALQWYELRHRPGKPDADDRS